MNIRYPIYEGVYRILTDNGRKNFKGNGQTDGKEKPKPHTFRL